jgi:hypothetical protein
MKNLMLLMTGLLLFLAACSTSPMPEGGLEAQTVGQGEVGSC